MSAASVTRSTEGTDDRAALAATALPREADPSQNVAAKISARLLHTYGADDDGMKGHAA